MLRLLYDEWWFYTLIVICIYFFCVLLNYVVKKMNDLKHEKRLKKMESKWSCHTIEDGTEFIKNKLENTSIRKGKTFIFEGKGNNIDSKKSLFSNGDVENCKTSDFMVQLDNSNLHSNSKNDNINGIESNIRVVETEIQTQDLMQSKSEIKQWLSDIIKSIKD